MPKTATVTTTDGVSIALACERQRGSQSAVIICPGFCQSKDTPTFQRMSKALAGAGDVITMDFRGHGQSSGFYTFSARESADLQAVLTWATARYPRLGVMGFSMGAAIAINTVSQHPHGIAALVAVSAPFDFDEIEFKFWTPEAMRSWLLGLGDGAGCRPGNPILPKARPLETIQKCRGVPVMLVHGTKDAIVDVRHSRRLHEAAPEPKALQIIEGGGHAEVLFLDDPAGFLGLIEPWLARWLDRGQP